jgi:hypothetical protein
MFIKITALYFANRTLNPESPCKRKAELLIVKACGTFALVCCLKCQEHKVFVAFTAASNFPCVVFFIVLLLPLSRLDYSVGDVTTNFGLCQPYLAFATYFWLRYFAPGRT